MILAFRFVLLAIATGAVAAAVYVAISGSHGERSGARYACPMHPEARSAAPGECPICRMALTPIGRDPTVDARHPETSGAPDFNAVYNIHKYRLVERVARRTMLSLQRVMRGPARVGDDGELIAVFYEDQILSMAAGEPGLLQLARAPSSSIPVRRTPAPPIRWDRSTSLVHFRIEPPRDGSDDARSPVHSDDAGWIELEGSSRDLMVVPDSAVIQSSEGPYVLAAADGGRFEKRPIEIGETFPRSGLTTILSGLESEDRVVSHDAFFMDAERRVGNSSSFSRLPATGLGSDH